MNFKLAWWRLTRRETDEDFEFGVAASSNRVGSTRSCGAIVIATAVRRSSGTVGN